MESGEWRRSGGRGGGGGGRGGGGGLGKGGVEAVVVAKVEAEVGGKTFMDGSKAKDLNESGTLLDYDK